MFNIEVIRSVQHDLTLVHDAVCRDRMPGMSTPGLLYYPATAASAERFAKTKALDAVLSTGEQYAADRVMAVASLLQFLERRQLSSDTPDKKSFANSLFDKLQLDSPGASCFVASLFGSPFPIQSDQQQHAYSFGIRTPLLSIASFSSDATQGMVLEPAVYGVTNQHEFLAGIYDVYEAAYLSALQRYGQDNIADILPYCSGALRNRLIDCLLRFRPEERRRDNEYIVTMLDPTGFDNGTSDHVQYRLVNDIFVPFVEFALLTSQQVSGKSLIERVVIHERLPYRPALVGIRQFMRHNGFHTVEITLQQN